MNLIQQSCLISFLRPCFILESFESRKNKVLATFQPKEKFLANSIILVYSLKLNGTLIKVDS